MLPGMTSTTLLADPDLLVLDLRRGAAPDLADSLRAALPGLQVRLVQSAASRPGLHPSARLTGQERRVLLLLTEGLTNRQIAQALALSTKTVKNYVSALLAKLGVERRTQAVALVLREGLPV